MAARCCRIFENLEKLAEHTIGSAINIPTRAYITYARIAILYSLRAATSIVSLSLSLFLSFLRSLARASISPSRCLQRISIALPFPRHWPLLFAGGNSCTPDTLSAGRFLFPTDFFLRVRSYFLFRWLSFSPSSVHKQRTLFLIVSAEEFPVECTFTYGSFSSFAHTLLFFSFFILSKRKMSLQCSRLIFSLIVRITTLSLVLLEHPVPHSTLHFARNKVKPIPFNTAKTPSSRFNRSFISHPLHTVYIRIAFNFFARGYREREGGIDAAERFSSFRFHRFAGVNRT